MTDEERKYRFLALNARYFGGDAMPTLDGLQQQINDLNSCCVHVNDDITELKSDITKITGYVNVPLELGKCSVSGGTITYTTSNYGVRIPQDSTVSVLKGDKLIIDTAIINNPSGYDIIDKANGVLIASSVANLSGYIFQSDYASIAISVNSYSSLAGADLTNVCSKYTTANIPYYNYRLDEIDSHLVNVDDSIIAIDSVVFDKNNYNNAFTDYTVEDGYYNYIGAYTENSDWKSYTILINDTLSFRVHSYSYGTGCYQYIILNSSNAIIQHGELGQTTPQEWDEVITIPSDAVKFIIVSRSSMPTNVYTFGGEASLAHDKQYIAFGDSVCRGNHPDSTKSDYAWPEAFASFKKINVLNKAIGGQGYKTTQYTVDALTTIQATDITNADLITLAFGINDASDNSVTIGTENDTTSDTMLGCVYQCINYIYTQNPKVQLVICGTTKQDGTWYTKLANVNEGLKTICEKYGIAFVDMSDSPINSFNGASGGALTSDGTHFNDDGYKLLAQYMTGQLSKYFGT